MDNLNQAARPNEISLFNRQCYSRYIAAMEQVNEWFRQKLEQDDDDDDNENDLATADGTSPLPTFRYAVPVCEYRRLVQDIQRRYSSYIPPPNTDGTGLGIGGAIVAMGNDDGNQLGFFSSSNGIDIDGDDAEKKAVYAPFMKRHFPPSVQYDAFRAISAGGMHSVALSVDGNPYTWGAADDGTLGRCITDASPEHMPGIVSGFVDARTGENEDGTIIQVATGDQHTLFLALSGNVYQCGTYRDMESSKFRDPPYIDDGTALIEGCNTQPVHVYQILEKVKEIFARSSYNVAILEDDSIVTWGFGNKGELARSATMNARKNGRGDYDLTKSYFYTKDGPKDVPILQIVKDHFLKPQPPIWAGICRSISQRKTVLHVATGAFHLLVTAREYGGGNNTDASSSFSRLYSAGLNNFGQLGHGDVGGSETDKHELTLVEALKDKDIVKVAAGQHHSLALNLLGTELYAFGCADYGRLGLGKTRAGESVSIPTLVRFPPRPNTDPPEYQLLVDIAAGELHSMARTIENDIYTWGFNESGATGHPSADDGGNDDDIVTPTLLDIEKHIQTTLSPNARVYNMSGGGQHSLLLVETRNERNNNNIVGSQIQGRKRAYESIA